MRRHAFCAAVFIFLSLGCGKKTGSTTDTPTKDGTPAKPAPAISSPASLTDAYGRVTQAMQRVTQICNGVTDDATARVAAPQVRQAAGELSVSMRQMKSIIAALDASGQKAQIAQFYQTRAEQGDQANEQLRAAIERVAQTPYYGSIKPEVGAVLDAMMENSSVKEREGIQRWVQAKNLR